MTSPDHARSGKAFRGKEHRLLHTVKSPRAAQALAAEGNLQLELGAAARYFDDEQISLLWDTWLHDVENLGGRRLDALRYRPNVLVAAIAG